MNFLSIENGRIVDNRGNPVRLRGINLGDWLLIEGYMLCGPNEPEQAIRGDLARSIGARQTRDFFRQYQDVFIQSSDLRRIRRRGFNVVRVPFNYRLFLPSPEKNLYERNGWKRLDWLIRECSRNGLYILLDMHASPGAQNYDWHSDSAGKAHLWDSDKNQRTLVSLWGQIARRCAGEPAVLGYDLLNEPILGDKSLLIDIYQRCLQAIRDAGDNHIVFLEGTAWSDDFSGLDDIDGDQLAYSPHFYKPYPFVFNTELDLSYPGIIEGKRWDKAALRRELARFYRLGRSTKRPVLIGEFGVNTRCSRCHAETRWVKDCVELFENFDFHWTYWSYKVLSGHMYPSGLLRYPQNPRWIFREGAKTGWKTWRHLSESDLRGILPRLDSKFFTVDQPVLEALQSPARP
jgi:aryl-phospho-beta-D-glucosidase BglC (GH1 family)